MTVRQVGPETFTVDPLEIAIALEQALILAELLQQSTEIVWLDGAGPPE